MSGLSILLNRWTHYEGDMVPRPRLQAGRGVGASASHMPYDTAPSTHTELVWAYAEKS
eukprot:CAMPEP_0194287142 /NCGR_PEP_ID=MMETSP0169-20130528/34084_1 /TAXON_ID=218684 /ORGANISM="Corethron pennatum, Strain L29A3" /LENGTH=57 /DNA_ID=CAMNT_0039033751 /DNA_START=267 /DNA_END=436 /DNA_ORIENTATION=+